MLIRQQPLATRLFLKAYPWRHLDSVPLAILKKPIAECRVALVTTAALVLPGDTPFDPGIKGGDYSFRLIPDGVDVQQLEEQQRSSSFDHSGIKSDRNLALPLDALHDLVADSTVGEAAPEHLSFMGSITAPGRLMKKSAPEAARLLVSREVDVALLVPV